MPDRPPPQAATGDPWDTHVHVFEAAAPVRPGHYAPVDRPLAEIEAVAAAHGVRRLVLVQPSVYGSDNGVLLRALASRPGQHRGVVVVDRAVDAATLDAWHALGVRGIRFNRVSPVGEHDDPASLLRHLAPALSERGWHVLWYLTPDQLPQALRWHEACGLPFVLDHLAGLRADTPDDAPAWDALQALAARGAWLKLSGWYRLGATAPYDTLRGTVRRAVAAGFGARLLWGSDWPHTSFAPDRLPPYDSTWAPVPESLGAAAAQGLRGAGAASLYAD